MKRVNFYFVRLNSCVKGEKVVFSFDGLQKMYLGLLTEEQYEKYKEDMTSVKRTFTTTKAVGTVANDGDCYAVFDNNGKYLEDVKTSVRRFAPSFTNEEARACVETTGVSYVFNADDTTTEGVMIDHWKKNQHKGSKLDLSRKTVICPSCCKTVSITDLHGAHVTKISDTNGKLYITPTCSSCNTSKTKRIFKVATVDLVEAPKPNK